MDTTVPAVSCSIVKRLPPRHRAGAPNPLRCNLF